MADRYYLQPRRMGGFLICELGHAAIAEVAEEAIGQRIVGLLNEEDRFLAQEPPPEAGWIDSLND